MHVTRHLTLFEILEVYSELTCKDVANLDIVMTFNDTIEFERDDGKSLNALLLLINDLLVTLIHLLCNFESFLLLHAGILVECCPIR